MLHDKHCYRLLLVVPDFDLKRLVGLTGSGLKTSLTAFSLDIESIAGIHAHGLVFGRVVDLVFAREFKLPILVAAIKTNQTLRQWSAQMIGGAV